MAAAPNTDSAFRSTRFRPLNDLGDHDDGNGGEHTASSSPMPYLFNPSEKHSKPSALTKLLGAGTIHIAVENPLLFLHPQMPSSLPGDEGPPMDDCILSGKVTLSLTKPREVKKIIVGVRGYSDVGFPDRPYETQTHLSQDLVIDLRSEMLDKGDNVFEWSFIIPSSTAPYERGPYGRTFHKVFAKAKGAGLIGDLETEAFWEAVCNPSGNDPNGELSLTVHLEDISPHLGPYMISLTSTLFTVSGLLSFHLSLASTPAPVTMHYITCHILQSITLVSVVNSRDDPSRKATSKPPPLKRRVFRIDGGANPPGIAGRGGWISQAPSRSVSRAPSPSPGSTPRRSPLPASSPAEEGDIAIEGTRSAAMVGSPLGPSPSPGGLDNLAQSIARRINLRDGSPTVSPGGTRPSSPTPPDEHRTQSMHRDASREGSRPSSSAGGPVPSSSSAARSSSHGPPRGRDAKHKKPTTSSSPDVPLAHIEPNQHWEVQHLARLPNDDHLRPSTHPGTKTPIRVAHTMSVEVVYSLDNEGAKKKVLSITKPVFIVSCCCMLESMVLPPYSEGDPHSEMQDPGHQRAARLGCVCGISTRQLLKTQDPTYGQTAEGELPPGAVAPKPYGVGPSTVGVALVPSTSASGSGSRPRVSIDDRW